MPVVSKVYRLKNSTLEFHLKLCIFIIEQSINETFHDDIMNKKFTIWRIRHVHFFVDIYNILFRFYNLL